MTAKEARKAMRWGLRQLGLRDWKVRLDWTNERPHWATLGANDDAGARVQVRCVERSVRVWVGQQECIANGDEPLASLFHELLHASAEDVGVTNDNEPFEFFLNRQAECMAFAYRKGMKPWR